MRGKEYDREYLVSQIAMMRIEGCSTHFILEFLKNEIKMSQSTAYEILKQAQDYIMKMTGDDLKTAYSEAINQIEKKMDGMKDKKLWLQYRAELNKLRGLYAAQKVEHSGEVKFTGIDIQIITDKNNEQN